MAERQRVIVTMDKPPPGFAQVVVAVATAYNYGEPADNAQQV